MLSIQLRLSKLRRLKSDNSLTFLIFTLHILYMYMDVHLFYGPWRPVF